jgi:glycosyltransferase involved in cell wall biosynthesis
MKVLLITTSYPDHTGSQRGIFIRDLCLELVKKGLDVVVLTPRVLSTSSFHELDCGIIVRRFWYPSRNTQLNQLDSIPILSMAIYMISGIITGLRTVRKHKPDIIHGNWIVPTGLIASIVGRISGLPVINTARGMDLRVCMNRAVKMFFDLAVKLSDKITVVSSTMRSIEGLEGAEVISSGVDPIFFDIIPNSSSKMVLYSRSLEPIYDTATLLKSIPIVKERIPDARFVIAGSGSQENHLKSLAHNLGISEQVSFIGHVPHETIAALSAEATVFVSTATADGTSIALMESIAAGLIPVVTDIDANRALVMQGRDGYLFKPRDEKDLAEKLVRALSHEISPQALQQKRDFLKDKIRWSIVANRFIHSYNQILEGSHRHS